MGMSVTMFFRLSTLNTSQINLIFLVHCSLLGLPSALLPEAKQRDSFGQLTPPHQVLTPVSYPYQSSYHENDHFKGLGMFQRYASTHLILTAIATKEDPIFSFMNKPTCKKECSVACRVRSLMTHSWGLDLGRQITTFWLTGSQAPWWLLDCLNPLEDVSRALRSLSLQPCASCTQHKACHVDYRLPSPLYVPPIT